MNYLEKLENKTIYIIRESYSLFKNIGLLWSIGKDSTTLLWIIRKAFFGEIPFPIIHIDTGFKFKEIYNFRDKYKKEWKLNLIISKNENSLSKKEENNNQEKLICCSHFKTQALQNTIKKYNFNALLVGIRRDEHGIRAKERYFSPRSIDNRWQYQNQPPEFWELFNVNKTNNSHFRIHPMLHWTETDIWQYIYKEKIPFVNLYLAKNGKRFRSIGCLPCCKPFNSKANSVKKIIRELNNTKISERDGRAQDKENAYTMQKLRSLGYL